jgi:hypothetical protein
VCVFAISITLLIFGGAFFGIVENLPKDLDKHNSYQQLGQPRPDFGNNNEEDYEEFRKIAGLFGTFYFEF